MNRLDRDEAGGATEQGQPGRRELMLYPHGGRAHIDRSDPARKGESCNVRRDKRTVSRLPSPGFRAYGMSFWDFWPCFWPFWEGYFSPGPGTAAIRVALRSRPRHRWAESSTIRGCPSSRTRGKLT